jgi:hypothetical protein
MGGEEVGGGRECGLGGTGADLLCLLKKSGKIVGLHCLQPGFG